MQLDLQFTIDLSKLYANDGYEKLTKKQALQADKLIKQALEETASALKNKLHRQDNCYDTTGMRHPEDFAQPTPYVNCVTHAKW